MTRRLIAGLMVLGLAIGVWALWPREEPEPSPTTTIDAVASTTSSTVGARTTSSVQIETHVVTTVEEAEEILRQLWFGWFEGIYNQDEERIKEVVGSQALLDDARAAFGGLAFVAAPDLSGVVIEETELLLASEVCLVIWSRSDARFIENLEETLREGVDVFRWNADRWVLVSSWKYKDDLWEADCASVLEPLS